MSIPRKLLRQSRRLSAFGIALLAGACVTINVYFPAAAAEKAADTFIEDVWRERIQQQKQPPAPSSQNSAPGPLVGFLEVLIPAAHAQTANLDISSAATQKIKASMTARSKALFGYFDSGAIGLSADGLIKIRDRSAVPIQERSRLNALVADENRDRRALYAEVARANGHPEWEDEIRSTFARRWVAAASGGWWYEGPAGWVRK